MIPARLITRALAGWLRWRSRRRIYAAYPELRQIDRAREEARRAHRPYKHFDEARKAFIVSALKGEV